MENFASSMKLGTDHVHWRPRHRSSHCQPFNTDFALLVSKLFESMFTEHWVGGHWRRVSIEPPAPAQLSKFGFPFYPRYIPANPPKPKPRTGPRRDVPAMPRAVAAATPAPSCVRFKMKSKSFNSYLWSSLDPLLYSCYYREQTFPKKSL